MTTKKTGKGSGEGRSKKTPAAKPSKAKPPARGTVRTKAAAPAARARKADAGEAEKPKRVRKPKAPPVEVVEAAPPPPPAPAAPRRVRKGEAGYSDRLRDLVDIGRQRMGIKSLRPGQPEALEHILAGRDVLAVMPTGSGKSLLYQLPSLVLPGLTVVVSPLIALIKDQIDKMKALGVAVCRVDSTLTVKQKREMEALVRAPGGKLLLTTPERMADPDFRTFLKEGASKIGVSLFVVDEAHCVSQWGHDFRPSYLVIRKALEDLGRPPVLGTTATAPPHVREDILHQLGMPREGGEVEIVSTTFDRPNLHYEVIASPGDDDKNRTLVTLLKKLPRPGIVYCATVKKVEELTESLGRHGIPVARYHGRLNKNERDEEQARFMAPKSELVMIATNAFGLGVDKRDIRYVMHYHVPGSLEQYAQEAGRGGRDDKPARCVLLFSPDDVAIQEFFLKGTYPTRRQVRAVYKALEAWDEHTDGEPPTLANLALGARVGVPRTRTVLSLLKDEGFVIEKEGGIFALTEPPPDERELNEKAKQYEARRIADRQRLDALLDYVRTPGCRSQVILRYLGEVDPPVCGRCDNDLRSKEAALAAAREATMLEDGVIQRLREEDQEDEDQASRQRRQVRARLIRIDAPTPAPAAAEADAARAPAVGPEPEAAGELARLVAEQEADERGAPAVVVPAPGPTTYDDDEQPDDDQLEAGDDEENELDEEGEFEEGDEDDDEFEDDDEYEDEDDEDEDDEDLAIDKTAAALAEEGIDPEDSEITVLARKRVPKPPRKKKQEAEAVDAGAGKRKRRRRRRKRRAALPPKSAFTTPVLVRPAGAPPPTASGHHTAAPPPPSGRGSGSGPLVEYVRGPMRINMTPVASATPNDVAPGARGKNRRRGRGPGGRPGGPPVRSIVASGGQPVGSGRPQGPRPGGAVPPGVAQQSANGAPGAEGAGKKRRRRRRRKRRGGEGQGTGQFDPTAPVHFFSVEGQPGGGGGGGGAPAAGGNGAPAPNGQKKRRRRRRRRGRGNRPDLPPGTERPPGAETNGQTHAGSSEHAAPPPPASRPPDGESRDGE